MTCDELKCAIPLFLYGELSFDDEDAFENHLDECAGCRGELARERKLHHAFDAAAQTVTSDQLWQSRRQLVDRLSIAAGRPITWWERLPGLFPFRFHLPGTAAQPIGALALIAMGFFGARMIPTALTGNLNTAGLADPIASRVRYVEPEASGKIQIVLEETRQRTLSGSLGDEKIQRLLLAAAKDPADAGLRVESMDILTTRPETAEVRNALLTALQHDPNAGVRLRALEGLKGSAGDSQVRQILSRVLLADKNPGVRTQVIDLLIQQKERPQPGATPPMVGVLQELMRKEDNGYVRMRCQKALHDMKASVETF